jgi:hypothetical protein
VISLPKDHIFEGIAVTNGKFVKKYSVDTTDIYIKSGLGYDAMKVKLVKEGNLLSLVDAQDTLQDYVKFYTVNKDLCYHRLCVNIDIVDDELQLDFLIWILVFSGIGGFVSLIIKKKTKSSTRKYPTIGNLQQKIDDSC